MTGLSSDIGQSSTLGNESERKRHFPGKSMDKLGNKRTSRIPIASTQQKKSNADNSKSYKNKMPAEEQKPFGKHSGIVMSYYSDNEPF